MSSKELNLGARAFRPHLYNTFGHAGGTRAPGYSKMGNLFKTRS